MSGLWAGLVTGVRGAIRPKASDEAGRAELAGMKADADTEVLAPRGYSPKNVGNDASARPWESVPSAAPLASAPLAGVPAAWDVDAFLSTSKAQFVRLQAAWNKADVATLRAVMTEELLEQIQAQLAERERSGGAVSGGTEVVMLDAHLLGVEDRGSNYQASVEFSGLLREAASAGPNPFREIWTITQSKADPAQWLVSGVQALQ